MRAALTIRVAGDLHAGTDVLGAAQLHPPELVFDVRKGGGDRTVDEGVRRADAFATGAVIPVDGGLSIERL